MFTKWKTAPRQAPKVQAAMRRAEALGPPALAELATLCMWLHWLKTQDHEDALYPGITLKHIESLLLNLVKIDTGPLPMPYLAYWIDDPEDQREIKVMAGGGEDDVARLAAFIGETEKNTRVEMRVGEQQARLQAFLDEGNLYLIGGALDVIKQNYLARDWKRYFDFGIALDNLMSRLQPYATAYRDVIFTFLSELLIENAMTAHFDPLLVTSCLNWFLVEWSGKDELAQLAALVGQWQARSPVVVLCVHNRIGRTIRTVQMTPADTPFDKTNLLLNWAGGQSIGSMLMQKGRIRRNDETYFVIPMPTGDGTYRLRIEAGGAMRRLIRTSTAIETDFEANQAYVWTVSGQGEDQVQPLEFHDDDESDAIDVAR